MALDSSVGDSHESGYLLVGIARRSEQEWVNLRFGRQKQEVGIDTEKDQRSLDCIDHRMEIPVKLVDVNWGNCSCYVVTIGSDAENLPVESEYGNFVISPICTLPQLSINGLRWIAGDLVS